MSFSVLICTYNRPELLRTALDALLRRTDEKPDQVVVVNGGDEHTDQVVAEFADCPGVAVTLIKTVNKNLAASRNVGIPHCTGAIVAMSDDDAEVFPDWVTQIKRIHAEHPEAGAVGGAIIGASSVDSLISRIADVVTFPLPTTPKTVRTLPGVNVSYKHAVLDQIGPQDEILIRGEDVDFNWRVIKTGATVYYHPDIKVIHHHRPSLRKLIQQHYMYGRGYYLVRRKWPEMYSLYPRGLRKPKDFLKLINFVASTFYQPFLSAWKMPRTGDKIRAIPVMFANQVAWKAGMLRQRVLSAREGR